MDDASFEPASEIAQLRKQERSLSARRTRLHNRIDFLRAGGGGNAEETAKLLEDLVGQEHEVSTQRRELHERIEALTSRLSHSGHDG